MQQLKKIGLMDSEIKVYLELLKSGEMLAAQLAEKTGISRTYIYDAMRSLMKKGLVSYVIKNNRKYFIAASPEKILDYLDEKEKMIKEEKTSVKKILAQLHALKNSASEKPSTEVYEGNEGLKTVLNDIIKTAKSGVAWGASDRIMQLMPTYAKKYIREREKIGIKFRQLYSKDTGVIKTPMSKFKVLPKEFSSPSTTLVYGNKVAIFIWSDIPVVIRIESNEVARSYKKHFEIMWKAIIASQQNNQV